MTSTAKSGITADVSGLVDLTTAEASDVLNPVTDLLTHIKSGRLGVTAADTHVKHLSDALVAGSGVSLTVLNPGANEQIQIAAAGGGGSGYIAGNEVSGSPETDVTVSASIPGTYKTLRLIAGMTADNVTDNLRLFFNNDTSGGDYSYASIGTDTNENGFGAYGSAADAQNHILFPGGLPTNGYYAVLDLHIHRYATTGPKYVQGTWTIFGVNAIYYARLSMDAIYVGSSPITRIDFQSAGAAGIGVGSWYELYGI